MFLSGKTEVCAFNAQKYRQFENLQDVLIS
jgi:hypothetical protein